MSGDIERTAEHRLRVGTAFKWRPDWPCEVSDLVRVVRAPDYTLVVMASAGECGFSTCWAPGSGLLLDLLVAGWEASEGSARVRLDSSVQYARDNFLVQARDLGKYVPEDDIGGGPHGCFVAAAVGPDEVACAWLGGDTALVARDYEPAWATASHDLKTAYLAEGNVIPEGTGLPDVIVRCIGDGVDSAPDLDSTAVRVGDAIVVANSYVNRRLGHEAIAFIASVSISPEEAAEDMVRLAYEDSNVPCAAACVIRIEDADVPERIGALINEFTYDGTHAQELERHARANAVMPLVFDMGGAIGFTREGRLVAAGWDDLEKPPEPFRHVGIALNARQRLAELSPKLHCVAPPRPPELQDCERCDERRKLTSAEDGGCPFCCYLGWAPPVPPGIAAKAYPEFQSFAEEARASVTKRWWKFWKRGPADDDSEAPSRAELHAAVAAVCHMATTFRECGDVSMLQLLQRSNYAKHAPYITETVLADYLRVLPALLDSWQ